MYFSKLPAAEKYKIMSICMRNGIDSLEDIHTAYNNFIEGKDIFKNLSAATNQEELAAFGHYLANGGHIYDGTEEPTQQMQVGGYYTTPTDNLRVDSPPIIAQESPIYSPVYQLPEVIVSPDSSYRSPGEIAILERERRANHDRKFGKGSYDALRLSEDFERQVQAHSKPTAFNTALDYTASALQGVGIGADIAATALGGMPVYSTLKGAQAASEGDYADAALWWLPAELAAGYKGFRGIKESVEKFKSRIPPKVWKEVIENYKNLINSEEYASRVRRAGLGDDYIDDMRAFTEWSLENPPRRVVKEIYNNPKIFGLSEVDPDTPLFGITVKAGLSPKDLKTTLLHEIAHFGTRNRGIDSPSIIGDIMRYNESIAENIPWEQKLWEFSDDTPLDVLNEELKWYEYLIDPQEKRSRAMEIYQHAKNAKMSIDDFIDKFIGKKEAPRALKDLSWIMTRDNLKKYAKNFLGITTPIGITSTIKQKQYEQQKESTRR